MAFLCFNKGNNHLGIKKGLKIAILTLFLASFLFPLKVLAKQLFSFDICQLNQSICNCYPQFATTTEYNFGGVLISTNDYYYSSPYSGKNNASGSGGFDFVRQNLCPNYTTEQRHRLDFKFMYPSFTQESDIQVSFSNTNYPFQYGIIAIQPTATNLSYTTTTITIGLDTSTSSKITLYTNTWYNATIFTFLDSNQIRHYQLTITKLSDNSVVFQKEHTTSNSNYYIFSHYFYTNNVYVRFDDIVYYCQDDISETGEVIIPTGFYLIWNLETPTPCQFPEPSKYNQVSTTTNFEVKGKLTIPIENPYTWYKLRLKFWNWNTNQILYFNFDLPNLKKEDKYSFDYFVDISSILSTSTDLISFSLTAYGKDDFGNIYYDSYPAICEIFLGLTSERPVFTPPEIQFPPQPELEDCSQYNIPDRWICEIKNALKSIFLPSSEKINELKQTMDLFKQKFPFNYIDLFTNFYQDINNGINETSTIQFKILGQSGNVNLAFWENQATIGGITQTFSHIIYNIFLFLFLFIFVLWLISYLKRIF